MTTCEATGKRRYRDRAAALANLADLEMRATRGQKRDRDEGLVPYRCRSCRGWHLGRPSK